MTCKLHLLGYYNPLTRVWRCLCGAVQVSDIQAANKTTVDR